MKTLPIRLRLALWYLIFFCAAGLILSLASWLLLRQSLTALATHELEERVDDLQRFLQLQTPGTPSYPKAVQLELAKEYGLKDEGKFLQVFDGEGNWLFRSQRDTISQPLPTLPPGTAIGFEFQSKRHHLRTLSRQFVSHGHTYTVATAISTDKSGVILAGFRRNLLLLTPMLLLMAAAAGHTLSRKALRPVATIAKEARRINDRNLATRLPALDSHDELSHLSETLNQMLERIEASFHSVRSFTANASHEMRTPISLIRTRVEVCLCFPRTAEQYRKTLEEVQGETVRMTDLLESLLRLARTDASSETLKAEPIELGDLLEYAAREWTPVANQRSLRLVVNPTETPVWISGDVVSMRRLLRILVDNACRYTPSGGIITLNATKHAGIAELSVRDTGIGIATEHLGRIFDRFYRVPRSGGLTVSGSGLGLSLARRIAEQHKATIDVESKPGSGSNFRIKMSEDISAVSSPS